MEINRNQAHGIDLDSDYEDMPELIPPIQVPEHQNIIIQPIIQPIIPNNNNVISFNRFLDNLIYMQNFINNNWNNLLNVNNLENLTMLEQTLNMIIINFNHNHVHDQNPFNNVIDLLNQIQFDITLINDIVINLNLNLNFNYLNNILNMLINQLNQIVNDNINNQNINNFENIQIVN